MNDETRIVPPTEFFTALTWLDKKPLVIEPYRQRIFEQVLYTFDEDGRLFYSLALLLRAKKNNKSLDLILAALYFLFCRTALGGVTARIVAFDEGQASQDLDLAKKLVAVNPMLADELTVKQKSLERKDGSGVLEILPGRDIAGSHGGKYDLLGIDEVHGQKDWSLLEALAPDPTRESLQWITSYNSIFHKPGVPLFDLLKTAWAGTDPQMFFSYYAADKTNDPEFENASPEARANPSMASWQNKNYLKQEQRRLPSHKYRRLHLNLPGSPEGSAFDASKIDDCIERGVKVRQHRAGITEYRAFVDMSGGSSDDATLGIAHLEGDKETGRVMLDYIGNQGPKPPFNPRDAVKRFAAILKSYGLTSVVGDNYAGLTFQQDFEAEGISYAVSELTRSKIYEAFEPRLNSGRAVLLDDERLESQLLGLVWRNGKIDHAAGTIEHDDFSNAACGAIYQAFEGCGFGEIWTAGERSFGRGALEEAGFLSVGRSRGALWDDDTIPMGSRRFKTWPE